MEKRILYGILIIMAIGLIGTFWDFVRPRKYDEDTNFQTKRQRARKTMMEKRKNKQKQVREKRMNKTRDL